MTDGVVSPDLDTFRELARTRRVIPVSRRLLADGETPVGVFRKLAGDRTGTFLLESAERGAWSRYSFVGARCAATLTERDGEAHWLGDPPAGVPTGGDPLDAVRETVRLLRTEPPPGLPPLTGGLVGYVSYDAVRRLERLPSLTEDDLRTPELALLLATDLAVLDHAEGTVTLIANAVNWDDTDERVDWAFDDACRRLEEMTRDLASPAPSSAATFSDGPTPPDVASVGPALGYQPAVEIAREHIRAGDVFQVVLSQRFQTASTASPLDVYRVLRVLNPSPYMYLLQYDGFSVVGSSPEALVKVSQGRAMVHPIAGTRPRGATPADDAALAAALLGDSKERSEHVMLVDLARNDLGRVCRVGSVDVVDLMSVERFSHVMHLVSTVVGDLAPDRTSYDALLACFPAGTLAGAPKPRAMEIIESLEPVRRGLYGGAVVYLDFAGDIDSCIAIRTALLRDGTAYVQAGAGIVADSVAAAEDAECRAKAAAVLTAVHAAASLCPA